VLFVWPILAAAALALIRVHWLRPASGTRELRTFLSTSTLIVALLASVFSGLFPRLLPPLAGSPFPGLDIYNAAAPLRSLQIALAIYLVGMLIVVIYLVRIYRVWSGKVAAGAGYHA